ncbi:MAG: hypothetical protein CSA21_07380 [Deltaproteobacteria bacterium]|nr:MAG: hypothetical protein CSA21_07380 [Deltaproteobacteria bacterium]
MNNDNEESELMRIDDPRIPEIIREHAAAFETPVCYVTILGENILLSDEDGELVDICSIL